MNNQKIDHAGLRVYLQKLIKDAGLKLDEATQEYYGVASDGTEVSFGHKDNERFLLEYLADHPTPDTW